MKFARKKWVTNQVILVISRNTIILGKLYIVEQPKFFAANQFQVLRRFALQNRRLRGPINRIEDTLRSASTEIQTGRIRVVNVQATGWINKVIEVSFVIEGTFGETSWRIIDGIRFATLLSSYDKLTMSATEYISTKHTVKVDLSLIHDQCYLRQLKDAIVHQFMQVQNDRFFYGA